MTRDRTALIRSNPARTLNRLSSVQEKLTVAHQEQELAFRALIETHKEHQSRSAERNVLERNRNDLMEKQRDRDEIRRQIEAFHGERTKLLGQLSETRDGGAGFHHQTV